MELMELIEHLEPIEHMKLLIKLIRGEIKYPNLDETSSSAYNIFASS
jgi:hypothetical protein